MVCPKAVLAARLPVVESQLAACQLRIKQKKDVRPRFTAGFRFLWLFVERYVGTLRLEMFDHVIILSQGHLERLLRAFIEEYYHVARPHQGLDGATPVPHTKPGISGPSKLISISILSGLHHRDVRVAA